MNLSDDAGKNVKEIKKKNLGFLLDDFEIKNINSLRKNVVFGTYDMIEQQDYIDKVPAIEEIRNKVENTINTVYLASMDHENMIMPYINNYYLDVVVAVRDYFSEEQIKNTSIIFKNLFIMQNIRIVPDSTCLAAGIASEYNFEIDTQLEVINYTGIQVTKSLYNIIVKEEKTKDDNIEEKTKDDNAEEKTKEEKTKDENVEEKVKEEKTKDENVEEKIKDENVEEKIKDENVEEKVKEEDIKPKKFIRTVKLVESKVVDDIGDEFINNIIKKHLAKIIKEKFAENQINVSFIGLEKLEEKYFCDVSPFVPSVMMYMSLGGLYLDIIEIFCYNVDDQNDKFVLVNFRVELESILTELKKEHNFIEIRDNIKTVRLSVYQERNKIFRENEIYTTHRNLVMNGMSAVCRKDLKLIDERIKIADIQIDSSYKMLRNEILARRDAKVVISNKENILMEFKEKYVETKEYKAMNEAFEKIDNSLINIQNLLRTIDEMKKLKQKLIEEQILLNSNINTFKYLVKTIPQKYAKIMNEIKTEYEDAKDYLKKNEFTIENLSKKENTLRTVIFKALNKIKKEEEEKRKEEEKKKKAEEKKQREEEKMKEEEEKQKKEEEKQKEEEEKKQKEEKEKEKEKKSVNEKGNIKDVKEADIKNNIINNEVNNDNSSSTIKNDNEEKINDETFNFEKFEELLGNKFPERMEAFKKLKNTIEKKKEVL